MPFSSSSMSCRTRHIPGIMHEPWQSLQFCMNFNHLWVVSIIYYKCMHLIIHFNPGATQVLPHTFFFPLLFNIVTEMPIANNSIDSWQQQINCSIFRLQFKNMLATRSPIATLPWIMQAPSKVFHIAACGLQGIALIKFSASSRWPAWPRRSTMQV